MEKAKAEFFWEEAKHYYGQVSKNGNKISAVLTLDIFVQFVG